MNKQTIIVAGVALVLGGLIGYVAAGERGYGERGGRMMHAEDERYEAREGKDSRENMGMMSDSSMAGMDHGAMMVASEKEFLAGMIPHHQEAVDTANEVLERGGSTEGIRTLAANIITAQETEIALMKGWYLEWYGEDYQTSETYEPMMRELAQLSGAELDKVFLEDMVMHHMGAIMMAQSVQPHIEHQEIEDLAVAINTTQTKEITLMRQLLSELE